VPISTIKVCESLKRHDKFSAAILSLFLISATGGFIFLSMFSWISLAFLIDLATNYVFTLSVAASLTSFLAVYCFLA